MNDPNIIDPMSLSLSCFAVTYVSYPVNISQVDQPYDVNPDKSLSISTISPSISSGSDTTESSSQS